MFKTLIFRYNLIKKVYTNTRTIAKIASINILVMVRNTIYYFIKKKQLK